MKSALLGTILALLTTQVSSQTVADLAKDPALFIKVAGKAMHWSEPTEPFKVAGPIYFIGTVGLGVFLIDTSQGLIVLNTGMPDSGPMIEASIRKLGFDPTQIKLIVTSHAHIDHAAGHAYLQKLSGAKVVISAADQPLLESGGADDFHYAGFKEYQFDPVKADIIVNDGDVVKLGEIALTAHATKGHSKGSVTWTTTIVDGGQAYLVVIPDGCGVNPGYRVEVNPSYPGIEADYRNTFHTLEMIKPDIWLALHNETDGLFDKANRAKTEGIAAWVDPEGYRQFVVDQRNKFEQEVADELGQSN